MIIIYLVPNILAVFNILSRHLLVCELMEE